MLKLYESVPGTYVLSLRTGGPVGTVVGPIINPKNLYIEGWFVEDNINKRQLILVSNDIRDLLPQGFVINDHEVLTEPDELIRLKDLLALNFKLLNLKVTSESGKSYGKVNDFALDTGDFFIHKLYAGQPLVRNFGGGNLSIDRSQIIEITDRRVIISDPTEAARVRAASPGVVS